MHKDNGAEQSSVRDVWYSEVTEELTATPVTRIAEAFQQLSLNNESSPPVQQVSSATPVDL